MHRLRIALGLVTIAPLAAAQYGCRGVAEDRVRSIAFNEAFELRESPAAIDDRQVDEYFDELGTMVLGAARDLESVSADKAARTEGMTAYDRFEVVVVHSVALNAWVYGEDFACITSNLVMQAESPEEIVAVLCHEFAHLEECHLVEAAEREMTHYAVSDLIEIGGSVLEIASYAYGLPLPVTDLTGPAAAEHRASFEPHKPSDEFEADVEGLELYASMGLDLDRFDDFYERTLELAGDQPEDSHPMMSARLRRLRAVRDRLPTTSDGVRELNQEEFREVQSRLRDVLLTLAREGNLMAYEEDGRACAIRARHATACGPLYPDRDELVRSMYRALSGPQGVIGPIEGPDASTSSD